MSDCCSSLHNAVPHNKRHRCPLNGQAYKEVSSRTILHHIKEPWRWNAKQQTYYFCEDPNCEVVYFGQDNSVINTDELRNPVGIKENSSTSLFCYCFGVSYRYAAENQEIKQFISEKTSSGICACEVRNPSGRCCLKDFPK